MVPLLIIYGVLGVVWLAHHGVGLILVILVTIYLADCTIRPRIKCKMCDGTGSVAKRGRRLAQCPICKGRKIHTRLGSRVWRRNRYHFHDDPDAEDEEDRPSLHDRGWW